LAIETSVRTSANSKGARFTATSQKCFASYSSGVIPNIECSVRVL
jgi:hypothetical protein